MPDAIHAHRGILQASKSCTTAWNERKRKSTGRVLISLVPPTHYRGSALVQLQASNSAKRLMLGCVQHMWKAPTQRGRH